MYRVAVHLFGATSSPSVASYALRRTATDDVEKSDNNIFDGLLSSLKAALNKSILIRETQETKELCALCGFKLEKYVSTNRDLYKHIPRDAVNQDVLAAHGNVLELPTVKVLGVD